jgi:hypothetical protein
MTITPYTANRAVKLIAFCDGDLNKAAYECRLTLQSLGSYTDRKTSAVLAVVNHLQRATPERQASGLAKLAEIAAMADQGVR